MRTALQIAIICGLLIVAGTAQAGVVFHQSFDAGGVPGDYVGMGANQFTSIASSNFTWSISSNALQMASATNGAAAITITNLPVLDAAIIQFTVNMKSIAALGGFITLTTGSGFNASVAKPAAANAHDYLTINFKAAGTSFINQSGDQSTSYVGSADAFWVVNNSGAAITYTAPDSSVQTVGNDKYDLWVGTGLVFDEAIAVNCAPITGIKISQAGGCSVSTFDNFKITKCVRDAAVGFEQNFNAGGVLSDYTGTGANQFNGITSSNFTWSINSNALRMASTTNGAAALTITNLPVLGAAIFQFTVNLKTITALGGYISLATGSGFDTSVAKPPVTNDHDRLTINYTATGVVYINESGSQSVKFAGSSDAFWVVNNSGATMTYMAPDFTKQTVGNDKYDLWVGTNLVFNEVAAVNFAPITGIKISQSGGSSDSTFDNFKITDISQQKVGLTEYLYDGFADGNMTANPAWANLSGTAVVTNDAGSNALLFTSNSTRYSASVPALVSGKVTIKYRVKKTGTANAAGLYLVNAAGGGYGFITDLNGTTNLINLLIKTTTNSGASDTNVAGNVLWEQPSNVWYTAAVLWDIDAGTFKFYIDGTPVGVTLTNTSYSTFTKVIAYGKFANTILMDDIQINQTPESIVTELSWYTPAGLVVNKTGWGGVSNGNYNYQLQKESGIRNYPFPPDGVTMPTNAPAVGSDAYYDLQYQAALKSDLPKMKKSGFDVVVFDMLSDPQYNPDLPLDGTNAPLVHYKTFLKWVDAAEQVRGIKVGLFAEGAGTGLTNTVAEWVECLQGALDNLPDSDAVWKIDNMPALMMFGNWQFLNDQGTAPYYGWEDVISSLRATNPFYFIVDTIPSLSNYGKWSELADAGYCFGPAGPSGWLTDTNTGGQMYMLNLFAAQTNYPHMSFYPISSPGYYNPNLYYGYTQPDFDRINDVYMNALDAGAERVHVLTWNDFGEDTDIMPSANKTSALLDVYSFYNTWLKTGIQPSAQDENITIAYPLHIPDTVGTLPVNWGTGRISPPFLKTPYPNPTGRVFYWANVKTAQTLQVNNLPTVDLEPGLNMGEISSGISTGAVTVTLNGSPSTNVLPAINHIGEEGSTEGGLQFHYIRVK